MIPFRLLLSAIAPPLVAAMGASFPRRRSQPPTSPQLGASATISGVQSQPPTASLSHSEASLPCRRSQPPTPLLSATSRTSFAGSNCSDCSQPPQRRLKPASCVFAATIIRDPKPASRVVAASLPRRCASSEASLPCHAASLPRRC